MDLNSSPLIIPDVRSRNKRQEVISSFMAADSPNLDDLKLQQQQQQQQGNVQGPAAAPGGQVVEGGDGGLTLQDREDVCEIFEVYYDELHDVFLNYAQSDVKEAKGVVGTAASRANTMNERM